MAGVYAELHLTRTHLDGQANDPPPLAWERTEEVA